LPSGGAAYRKSELLGRQTLDGKEAPQFIRHEMLDVVVRPVKIYGPRAP
jgi:hypothetical protein